jgi:hypothetical protein
MTMEEKSSKKRMWKFPFYATSVDSKVFETKFKNVGLLFSFFLSSLSLFFFLAHVTLIV